MLLLLLLLLQLTEQHPSTVCVFNPRGGKRWYLD